MRYEEEITIIANISFSLIDQQAENFQTNMVTLYALLCHILSIEFLSMLPAKTT